MRHELKTCRFCGMSNYEHNHPAAKSHWFRYGPRHSAHLKCFIEKRGPAALIDLPRHIVEQFPYFELQELGALGAARIGAAKRYPELIAELKALPDGTWVLIELHANERRGKVTATAPLDADKPSSQHMRSLNWIRQLEAAL